MQTNDVGMDEFMTLCKLIGVEPYITVNAGFGDAHSAAEEVEYMNGSVSTPMGAMRAQNGHPEPYHVKFWDIGNEPYGAWQLGRTDLKYYVLKHNEFAKAMRTADPSITLLASGSMPDEDYSRASPRDWHIPFDQAGICSDADWTGGFLKHSWGNFDGITEHWYTRAGCALGPSSARKRHPGRPPRSRICARSRRPCSSGCAIPSNRVHLKGEEWQEYEQRFPAMIDKKIFMSNRRIRLHRRPGRISNSLLPTPWSSTRCSAHTDFLTHVGVHHGRLHAGLSTRPPQPSTRTDCSSSCMASTLARAPFRLRSPATRHSPRPRNTSWATCQGQAQAAPRIRWTWWPRSAPDHKFLTLAVVNATDSEQKFDLNVTGVRLAGTATLWQMTGKDLDAANHVGQPPQVEVKETAIGEAAAALCPWRRSA